MANITRLDPLDDLFLGFFVQPVDFNGSTQPPPSIKMDVQELGCHYLAHAELPGVKKNNIHVVVDGNQVSISAEVKQQKEVKGASAFFPPSAISARFPAPSKWGRKSTIAVQRLN